ncbi:protein of unknown function [Magnetospirillum sp. XM-1]|uniref:hypothetical protein n=1 Tax=Magnetospirillum sp. XM-1 TaxID=1663591 RepID=UPI00073DF3E7|nr:hypothetical protein [Magnetospirillum sp. XM-1]CUW37264.1 protein of unknown function [Magnetospirillum sp. XM-1]
MLSIPDIRGEHFCVIKESLDAIDITSSELDKSSLCWEISSYITRKSKDIGDELVELGSNTLSAVESLDDKEVATLLALLQGYALAANAGSPARVWDDFIWDVYGENSDHAESIGRR